MERSGRLGGLAVTDDREGFLFNQGPHALYRGGPAEAVLGELGIKVDGGVPPAKGRVVIGGRSEIAPAGALTLARTRALGAKDKVQVAGVLARLPKIDASVLGSTSVSEWVGESVSGARARALLHGLCRLATYVNDPDRLSAEVAVRQMQLALGPGVFYLHGGWQSLVDQLMLALKSLPNVTIETSSTVDVLPSNSAVIVAAGGPTLASKLLGRPFDVGPPAVVSCLDLGLRRPPAHDLVIGADNPFYFSNHSAVANLAPPGQFHATVVQYLGADDEPDGDAMGSFAEHAGVRQDDVVVRRRLHHMTTVSAIATAELGGLAGRPSVEVDGRQDVFVAGDWVGSEGHLADASLASAKTAALAALRYLDRDDSSCSTSPAVSGSR